MSFVFLAIIEDLSIVYKIGWYLATVDVGLLFREKIGLRTLWKSFRAYSRGRGYENGRSIGNFLINGNSYVRLAKNTKIVNKGSFWLGLQPSLFHVSTNPSALIMHENSILAINGVCHAGGGVVIALLKDAGLELGNDVYINSGSTLICSDHIHIGNGARISWNVEICDTDFHRVVRDDSVISKPIEIGQNVLIGRRAMIMKGVEIGSGCVVAAGAIVTKDVPEKCLVAGVPARIVKRNIKWE
jgi:acetyltransferase-like isoleucine patch superfamily enzyme